MNKENKTFCPKCNKEVNYTIRKELMAEYKGEKVNVIENIGVCNECGEDIFIMNLEIDNLKRLYEKYGQLTGICIKSKFARNRYK
ncbi:YgiT-type zinc finger protein [Clostridium botulinum C]|uniref:YgiT-type zinc finger protein n=2 Tax=Clostridium botulinum TaxID=1491 RepID=A0A9Q4TIX1_CLOBO|nr:YgiT-type zinc finger protein [Clostridium botulinum]EGO87959.1 DNA-binding protein [Clostridium botulinum C str. Stockholm]MCD3194220.1 YgiT-type zinc finger protein [Clostridium botulinum C]MCD3199151.1 YgiT-type zinc finger protein [Clostridium botulinum C]MCD3204626.1 YgiT-type zinc finger protein [Clostridium botulinum C]MCD3207969.1 YgiT-type zinc finger protein [Clostridium botulinum C]